MADETPFAGLRRLHLGDPLDEEFLYGNQTVIDRLLLVGARTHRHDAHAALADPPEDYAPLVETDDAGGTIPADTDIYVGITFLDADGGETLISDTTLVTTRESLETPTTPPTVDDVTHVAGSLLANDYSYAVTVVDGTGGETPLGPAVTVTVDPGFANSTIELSGLADIVAEVGGTGWRLWRQVGGGRWGMVDDGTGDTLADDGSFCVDCDVEPPSAGTTAATSQLRVTAPATDAPAGATNFNVYASLDGTFSSPCLLATYPIADLDDEKTYTTLELQIGSPPVVNLSLPGADKIDPDTEMVDFPWKRSVATVGDLPATGNTLGDVRVVEADGIYRFWDGDSWNRLLIGHLIVKPDGTVTTPRDKLKFQGAGVTVTDDAGGGQTVVDIPGGGGGGGSVEYVLGDAVDFLDETGGIPAVRLRSSERTDDVRVVTEDFDGAAGGIGDTYSIDGSGNAIPTDAGNNTDKVHYVDALTTIPDGYVERTMTFVSDDWTRTGVSLGFGRRGLFAWVTKAGNIELRERDVDTGADADYILIADEPMTAPAIGDTINIQLERVGNHLHMTVFQGKAVIGEVEGDTTLTTDFGDGTFLYGALSDRWTDDDAWTTDSFTMNRYNYHRELWATAISRAGGSVERLILDDVGPTIGYLNGMTTPYGYAADWGDGTAIPTYRRDMDGEVILTGQAMQSTGTAPVDGDIIGQLEPLAAPFEPQLVPVATGDDDGVELGMIAIAADGTITWRAGRSTTPAVKHPFVSLDGISYKGA